ncbi:hypothetical protein D9757_005843 [Collybiopsis confluens]|uniref:6-phosphofructo-2-kinase domain-containing protein n=1 Tax=Collybiopsis confluens TaxID=2823264 RepID=A0A8H5HNM9_9AGAR|nr:hypothetical protein D9757_005843 [Collybiopsis confluens]
MVAPLYTTDSGLLFHAGKILVITIGLPARGKTHISRALERYLRWMGVKTQVVSLGDFRRKTLGGAQKLPPDYFHLGEKSPETLALRRKILDGCEQHIWDFFKTGQVVIYDANNGTRAARQLLAEKFHNKGIHVIFLESLCDNKEIIEANIRSVKISSPDYRGWNPDDAVEDYYTRIQDHEKYYETVEEKDWPYIRILNVGEKIMVNVSRTSSTNKRTYAHSSSEYQGIPTSKSHCVATVDDDAHSSDIQSRIVFFVMNIHNRPRTIYFARSGQSLIEHSYKADSDLSPAGWEYAEKLKDFVLQIRAKSLEQRGLNPQDQRLVIWTSTRRRAHHSAWPFLQAASVSGSSIATPAVSTPTSITNLPILEDGMKHMMLNLNPNPNVSLYQTTMIASSAAAAPPLPPPNIKVIEKPQMSEINPGVWDGLTPDQARKYYPQDWERFLKDPYAFRAPRAESYHDLSVRLEPILIELEREKEDLLIIGHASVIRCLLAYLIGLPASEIPAIEIARGDLLEVIPASYGVASKQYHFWDGPGRRGGGGGGGADDSGGGGIGVGGGGGSGGGEGMDDGDYDKSHENNFYENYAEDTKGKRKAGSVLVKEPEASISSVLGGG